MALARDSRREPSLRQEDREIVAELKMRGKSDAQIKEHLESIGRVVSLATITKDWKQTLREWAATRNEDISLYLAGELHRIDMMSREAWGNYEKAVVYLESLSREDVTVGYETVDYEYSDGGGEVAAPVVSRQTKESKVTVSARRQAASEVSFWWNAIESTDKERRRILGLGNKGTTVFLSVDNRSVNVGGEGEDAQPVKGYVNVSPDAWDVVDGDVGEND